MLSSPPHPVPVTPPRHLLHRQKPIYPTQPIVFILNKFTQQHPPHARFILFVAPLKTPTPIFLISNLLAPILPSRHPSHPCCSPLHRQYISTNITDGFFYFNPFTPSLPPPQPLLRATPTPAPTIYPPNTPTTFYFQPIHPDTTPAPFSPPRRLPNHLLRQNSPPHHQ